MAEFLIIKIKSYLMKYRILLIKKSIFTKEDIENFKRDEDLKIPLNIDYSSIGSLSNEVVERRDESRPETLAAAGKIPGVTPAALVALLRFVKRFTPTGKKKISLRSVV